MEPTQPNQLMNLFLDFGEEMISSGGEISRVETSLSYLCRAFGALETNVFVITSSILLTVRFQDGQEFTRSRRITKSGDTDYEKLRLLSDLSRACAEKAPPIQELSDALKKIKSQKPHWLKRYLGSILAAGGFCLFFGGTIADALLSALFGALICLLQDYVSPKCPNKVFFLFASSLFCGIGIGLTHRFFPIFQMDMVIIGDIMLLVPGIAITESVRDMLIGDTISGATRLLDSLMRTGALAAGFMIAILMLER